MIKSERVKTISKMLNTYFPSPDVPLNHSDPFTLLIAVLLSAQCTDERVNKITPLLFQFGSTPEDMILLGQEKIRPIIRPLGLSPRKSKAIFELSKILVKKYDSKVPEDFQLLEELPGVGHKTASVVMSQAFDHPAFPVDTHIHRLAQRWKLTNGKDVVQTEKDLKDLFPKEHWNKLHLQIIFYARQYCPARKCFGLSCPICVACFPGRKQAILTKK